MLDDVAEFIFSALVGLVALVAIVLLARRNMIREMAERDDAASNETGKKELQGQGDAQDPS